MNANRVGFVSIIKHVGIGFAGGLAVAGPIMLLNGPSTKSSVAAASSSAQNIVTSAARLPSRRLLTVVIKGTIVEIKGNRISMIVEEAVDRETGLKLGLERQLLDARGKRLFPSDQFFSHDISSQELAFLAGNPKMANGEDPVTFEIHLTKDLSRPVPSYSFDSTK